MQNTFWKNLSLFFKEYVVQLWKQEQDSKWQRVFFMPEEEKQSAFEGSYKVASG